MTYTETGLALIAGAVASGKKIKFNKVVLTADASRSAGAYVYELGVASVICKDAASVELKAVTDNRGFKGDYYFNQIDVYAAAADGQEVLFCFERSEASPVYIPRYDGRKVQSEICVRIIVSSSEAVQLAGGDGAYVLQSDFEDRMAQKSNLVVVAEGESIPESGPVNTWYLKVTDRQSIATAETLKVSPLMGIKVVV